MVKLPPEPLQVVLFALTSKPAGAVTVKLPVIKFTPDTLKVVEDDAVPVVVVKADGVPVVEITGVTTVKIAEVAAGAVFVALSVAVPAAIEMPRVPAPVMPEIVTVYAVPEPDRATVPLAVPVLFNVIFASAKVLVLKFASA